MLKLWHGTGLKYEYVHEKYFGTGEGQHLGYGYYTGEFRQVAVRHSRPDVHGLSNLRFIYETEVSIQSGDIWDLDSQVFAPTKDNTVVNLEFYEEQIRDSGPFSAMKWLRATGIRAIMSYEQDNWSHGKTYVLLDPSVIKIVKIEQFLKVDGEYDLEHWSVIEENLT